MSDAFLAAMELPDLSGLSFYLWISLILAVGMLIWDTVEVGRNDAANLINAVYGARVLKARTAIWVAGLGAFLGAYMSAGVIDTARKGIFDPGMLEALPNPLETALAIYVSVYIVDTALLYGYSAFGMPVSTTACLVFELLGASFAVGGSAIVKWPNAQKVIFAIILSIIISGIAGFIIQRMIRGAIGERCQRLTKLLMHGGWAGGGMLAMLTYFMIVKGMKEVPFVDTFNKDVVKAYGAVSVLFVLWMGYSVLVHAALVVFREKAARLLFPVLAVIGTVCIGFAFGQNDLANCASPGLAAYHLIDNRDEGVKMASELQIPEELLLICGALLLVGMMTRNAKRVTEAAVNAGSMSHSVALYAPHWCLRLARWIMKVRGKAPTLAPAPVVPDTGEARDYDALRACVILGVSASVIATASSFKLPVSTTYVAFAAVVATGAADRILQRGDGDLKLARTIWVIFSWFAAAVVAALATALVCKLVVAAGPTGILIAVAGNLIIRSFFKRRGEAQAKLVAEQARQRMYPEQFTEYEG